MVSAPPRAMTDGALSFSSSTIRCASLGPTPFALRTDAQSPSAIARPSPSGPSVLRIASDTLAPTPWTDVSSRCHSLSSMVGNPNSCKRSSRTTSSVYSAAACPTGGSPAAVRSLTCTMYPTPRTSRARCRMTPAIRPIMPRPAWAWRPAATVPADDGRDRWRWPVHPPRPRCRRPPRATGCGPCAGPAPCPRAPRPRRSS